MGDQPRLSAASGARRRADAGRAAAARDGVTPLAAELKRLIALEGPLSVERFMALCLSHPEHGYYMRRDPFGAAGDFITAPEISQMFGELIGLWAAHVWQMLGAPAELHLIECGPGRGTLMADALRAAGRAPAFKAALRVHLVETSPVLREAQAVTLATSGAPPCWHSAIESVPDGPAIIIGNEFLDALPIRQFVRTGRAWHERLVGLDEAGDLCFGLAAEATSGLPQQALEGSVIEIASAALGFVEGLSSRLFTQGGAALLIDYGHVRSAFGDTLQAMKSHRHVDLLAEPGEADVTAHVDFAALARVAAAQGAGVHGPVSQRAFLLALGLRQRAEALMHAARGAEQRLAVESAFERLIDDAPTGMGSLFKVVALSHPALGALPGFDTQSTGR
ncbi:MAG: SAM-dependent methyltransferase [Beijerinckiaceae bacterium]|nr:SAM-dependent methyltransferase [Beijerinckiaceae bacterium]